MSTYNNGERDIVSTIEKSTPFRNCNPTLCKTSQKMLHSSVRQKLSQVSQKPMTLNGITRMARILLRSKLLTLRMSPFRWRGKFSQGRKRVNVISHVILDVIIHVIFNWPSQAIGAYVI